MMDKEYNLFEQHIWLVQDWTFSDIIGQTRKIHI
jgi:hypothetical protein